MIKTKHKTQPKKTKETKQPKEPKQTKQPKQTKETKQQKQTKKNKETKKPKKIYKGGNNSTVAFTYQIKDINSAINKYEIIFIERQEKLLHLCNNFINKLKASEGSLNNKYKIFSYSTKYDKSRYLTLINKEFYENIFKNYFIPILQIINKDNIVTEKNDLNKIAEYLNFITDDDVDTNDEKRKKINRDFQIFEKYVTDDNIDEVELKKDVENTLGKLKNLMATTNFDKDKIIDIKDLKEKIDIINNKIDKWKPPSWQDILLSTFDSDIETINKKGLHKYSKIYIDAIDNFVSIGGSDLNDYDEKSISKIKNEIEKALKKIRELREDENNEKDTAELLNIVLINIKKLLLNLINKNYTKNISSIQKLKQYCKKETAEIDKYIDNYKIKLDEFSMQKSSSIPEEPKKENIEKPPDPTNKQKETFDSPLFTEEDVERIRTKQGALAFWEKQGIKVDPNEIIAELSKDGKYVTTYWNSTKNEGHRNENLALFKNGQFFLNDKLLQGNDLFKYAEDIKDKRVFKAKTFNKSGEEITIIENESTSSEVPATRTLTEAHAGTPVGTPTGTQAEAPGAQAPGVQAPAVAATTAAPGTGTNGFGKFGDTPGADYTAPAPGAQRALDTTPDKLVYDKYKAPQFTKEMKEKLKQIIEKGKYTTVTRYPPGYKGPFWHKDSFELKDDSIPKNSITNDRDNIEYINSVSDAWVTFLNQGFPKLITDDEHSRLLITIKKIYDIATNSNLNSDIVAIRKETSRILKNIAEGKEWLDDDITDPDSNIDEGPLLSYDRTYNIDPNNNYLNRNGVPRINKYGYPLMIAYQRCIDLMRSIKEKYSKENKQSNTSGATFGASTSAKQTSRNDEQKRGLNISPFQQQPQQPLQSMQPIPPFELTKRKDDGFWKAADREIIGFIIDNCIKNDKIDVNDTRFKYPPKYDKIDEVKYLLRDFEKNYSTNPFTISENTIMHNFNRLFNGTDLYNNEKLAYVWDILYHIYIWDGPQNENTLFNQRKHIEAYNQVKAKYESKLKLLDNIKEVQTIINNIKKGDKSKEGDKYYYDNTFNIDDGKFDKEIIKDRAVAVQLAATFFTLGINTLVPRQFLQGTAPLSIYTGRVQGNKYPFTNKYGYPKIVAYKKCSDLLDEILKAQPAGVKAQQRGTEYSPTPQSPSINNSKIGADATAAPQINKEGFISKVKSAFRDAIDEQVNGGIRYQIEQDEKDKEEKQRATEQYIRTAAKARVQNGVTSIYNEKGVPVAQKVYAGGGNNKKNTRKVSISKESKYKVCGYVTDVEGNMDYFNKYVKISKILEWTNDKKNRLRFKKGDSIFVYGGDTQDKGHADIRFVNILLKFKEDYPDRVIFIIGNRDANKLRIPSELFETYKNEKIFLKKYDNYPYWIDSYKRITLKTYLKENNYELNIKNRLKYIIESNMGFQDGFEKRRTELSIILKKNISKITDTDVISSFVNSVMPFPENIELSNDNYILKYLMKGQIAYIFGEHIFVHGAINEYNIGQIPKNKNKIDDVNIWVNELNSWFHKELNEYINNPTVGGITKKRKAYNIIDYVIPKEKNISVVHANNLKNGNGKHINKNVSKILNKYGIKNIITGHKPHGDCPLVIRDKNITAISADTSYSNVNYLREKNKIEGDNRGNAVSEVLLYSNGYIRIHGKYANNTKYSYLLKERANEKNMELNDYIGMQLNNKYWIKNIKKDKFLISYGKDYELYEKWISLKEVKELLK
jgi:hypothetical protein